MSSGSSAIAPTTAIRIAATIAGTIVIANEPPPGNRPVPRPMPSISTEPA